MEPNDKRLTNLIPFKLGEDDRRNTTGKNKGIEHSKTRLKRMLSIVVKGRLPTEDGTEGELQELTILELMDAAIIKKAIKGDLAAYNEIMNRFEGRAREEVRQTIIKLGKDAEEEKYEDE